MKKSKNISRRTFLHTSGLAGLAATMPLFGNDGITAEVDKNVVVPGNSKQFWLSDPQRHWITGIDQENGISHFGLDSEDTGRAEANLLADPVKMDWDGCSEKRSDWKNVTDNRYETTVESADGTGNLKWSVSKDAGDMLWQVEYSGRENIQNFRIDIPISALQAAAVLIPAKLDKNNQGVGPWLLVAPDFGHMQITSESDIQLVGVNDGKRGGGSNAVSKGVDPRLRGQKWLEATGIKDFRAGKLNLKFCTNEPLSDGQKIRLRFHMPEMLHPEGIEAGLWKKIRRPYLNNWQPCGTWAGPKEKWYCRITFCLILHQFLYGFILIR